MPAQGEACRSLNAFDVVVVGGGVIGLAVAWRRAQRGLRVAVLERAEPGSGTSRVAAGMLAPIAEADVARAAAARGSGSRSAAPTRRSSPSCARHPGAIPATWLRRAARRARPRRGRGARRASWRCASARARRSRGCRQPRPARSSPRSRRRCGSRSTSPTTTRSTRASSSRRCGGAARAPAASCATGAEVRRLRSRDGARRRRAARRRVVPAAEQVVVAAGAVVGADRRLARAGARAVRPVKGQILRLHDPAGPGLLTRVLRMRPATSSRAATAGTCSARRWRSAGSTRR